MNFIKKFIFILGYLFLIFTSTSIAEIVIETGKHKHLGKNYTKFQSCKIAEEKAKKKAIIKSFNGFIL